MNPAAVILAFFSCWSIAVVGGYLAVVGLGNLRRYRLVSQPPADRRVLLFLQRQLFLFWGVSLLLLGGLLMTTGMVIFYMLVYD